jgi:hypothetical protein
MDQTEQPRGNFTLNLNFRRNGNAKAPPITGRISTPEDPETEYQFSAFRHENEKGQYWIGPVDMNRSMRQALNTEAELGTNFVAIRENGFKVFKELTDSSPNPHYAELSNEEQALEDSKPAYWATWTRTENEPLLRAAAWEREPNRYGPWASGSTQHPMTKEQAAAMLNAPEPKAAPRRAKAKVENRDRA